MTEVDDEGTAAPRPTTVRFRAKSGREFVLRHLNALEAANAQALGAPNRSGPFSVASAIVEVDGVPLDPNVKRTLALEKRLQGLTQSEITMCTAMYQKHFSVEDPLALAEGDEPTLFVIPGGGGRTFGIRELNALESANARALGAPWKSDAYFTACCIATIDGEPQKRTTTDADVIEDRLEGMTELEAGIVQVRYAQAFAVTEDDLKNASSGYASTPHSSSRPGGRHRGSTSKD